MTDVVRNSGSEDMAGLTWLGKLVDPVAPDCDFAVDSDGVRASGMAP